MKLASLAFVSACAYAASTKQGAGYDAISAGPPDLLTGAGTPITPNPFKDLQYDARFSVVALSNELLPLLEPVSKPNVLVSQSTAIGYSVGSISKTSNLASFDATTIFFACAEELAIETIPVACNVLFEGTTNSLSGIPAIQIANYTATSTMQRVDFDGFEDLRRLSFAVRKAGADGNFQGNVTLLLDSFYYTLYTK